METSVFLAQSLAVFFGAAGLGFLFSPEHYRNMLKELVASSVGMFTMGILSLGFGLVILFSQSILAGDWTAILGFVGWAGLIKGIVFLVFPRLPSVFTPLLSSKSLIRFCGVLILCITGLFVYLGWYV
jgi:uncharacterized protein YjeT (DUF2065 family)